MVRVSQMGLSQWSSSMKNSQSVIAETLRLTTIGQLKTGDSVNIEQAARFNDEIGGLLSGRVGGTAQIIERLTSQKKPCCASSSPQTLAMYYRGSSP